MKYRGKLIAFEGIDRAGKSSIVARMSEMLQVGNVSNTVCGELHSPLTPVLREMLQKGSTPFLKTYFFASDRAWEYENNCLPALMRGDVVLWDRYVDSAVVYRAVEFQRGKSLVDIEFVRAINAPFVAPDLTIYIDISTSTSLNRARSSGSKEPYDAQFLEEVRSSYLCHAHSRNYSIINGEPPLEVVAQSVYELIKENFPGYNI